MPNQNLNMLAAQPSGEFEDQNAFTVIDDSSKKSKNVNIVKPVQRIAPNDGAAARIRHNVSASTDHLNDYIAVAAAPTIIRKSISTSAALSTSPQTILDPNFSRALDFKLRRLKDKQNKQLNRTKISASHPNLHLKTHPLISKNMSTSNPNVLEPKTIKLELPSLKENGKPSPRGSTATVSPGRSIFNFFKPKPKPDSSLKPRFVTTVKIGEFLLPPPEIATRLGLQSAGTREVRDRKMVYTYASKPNIVPAVVYRCRSKQGGGSHQSRCSAASAFGMMKNIMAGIAGMQTHELEQHIRSKRGLDGAKDISYGNVMYDRRVVRGSNYALPPLAPGDGESAAARVAETRRRASMRRLERSQKRPNSPPPIAGRHHEPIQTDIYLHELFDKGEEMTTGTQTDLFPERPITPIYVPAKTGCDVFTQIEQGDLFDFDVEVQPILEVLVGKTCEQALMECLEEEELEALREQQRRFRELRDIETAEVQRLEEENRRIEDEKERRIRTGQTAEDIQKAAAERVAAATLVQGYIADIIPEVLDNLEGQGLQLEERNRSLDEEFLPWLMNEVTQEIEAMITSRDILTEIVREIMQQRSEQYNNLKQIERFQPQGTYFSAETIAPEDSKVISGKVDSNEEAKEDTESTVSRNTG